MKQREKVCLPCEREKAKLPTFRTLAKQRAISENKIIVVVLDEEDKKFRIMDYEMAKLRGYAVEEYYTPL